MEPAPFPLRRVLLAATSLVIALGLVAELVLAGAPGTRWAGFFSLSFEGNFPTWYSSGLLLGAGLLFAAVGWQAPADRLRWGGLAGLFAYLSLDEAVELHEHLAGLVPAGGVFYFDWVIPATAILAGLAALYLPFVLRLPSPLRRRLIVAGVIYVTGALVLELPLGWWTERAGDQNLGYALIDFVEESLELVGASLCVVALWEHRR